MLPPMSAQLIRAGKLPSTSLPHAHVGLLARVGPEMRFHVAGLVVGFAAGGVGAVVDHWGLPQGAPLSSHRQGRGDRIHLGRCRESAVVLRDAGGGVVLVV